MWNMHDGFGWWMVVGTLWMALLWAALGWLFFRLIDAGRRGGSDGAKMTPIDEARTRYARGEITREQYLQIVADLQGEPHHSTA